jgi:hypothetical protein
MFTPNIQPPYEKDQAPWVISLPFLANSSARRSTLAASCEVLERCKNSQR